MNTSASNQPDTEKAFFIKFSKLEPRWDPNYYRYMRRFWERMNHCAFPLQHLGKSLGLVQYGISVRATEEPVGVPMLRMANLQDNSWDISELKYIDLSEEEKQPYLLKQGDLLFNRTNSKELVGKCNVFNLAGEYVFASYLIRVRLKEGSLLPDYVTAYLASSLGRLQIDAVSRQIAGMTNINAEEIRDLFIPVLDLPTQRKVADAWQTAIQKRDQTLADARVILLGIDDVLLAELGIKLQPEPPNTIESRIFYASFRQATGNRLDPLYHQGGIFDFIRDSNCQITKLVNWVSYFETGFAAGKNDQGDEEQGIIQIRPTNISNDRELVFQRNVYIEAAELSQRPADVLQKQEVLFNNTNSQEQVGKSAYFDLDGVYFSSNHITRIRTLSEHLDPQYLYYLLNLYQRRRVFFKLCTNWNNQSGIAVDILKSLPIPVPQLNRQKQIVQRLEEIRTNAHKLRQQAAIDLAASQIAIEALILGEGGES